jgi:hypothetical protein
MASVANGGYAKSASGYDIIFTSDNGCATKLNWETEYWDATGKVSYWVKIPNLSHTADNSLYVCVGNSAITTDQSNRTATWASQFAGVWHFAANGSNANLTDSTSNGNNWVVGAGAETTGAGVIAGAAVFNGATWSSIADNPTFDQQAFSLEIWFNFAVTTGGYLDPLGKGQQWYLIVQANDQDIGMGIGSNYYAADDYHLTAGQWHHFVWTYDGSNVLNAYVDGSLVNSRGAGQLSVAFYPVIMGYNSSCNCQYINASADEMRFYNTALGANVVSAEYQNQSNPNVFYSLNFLTSGAIATGRPIIW